jgi:hypothetical protein
MSEINEGKGRVKGLLGLNRGSGGFRRVTYCRRYAAGGAVAEKGPFWEMGSHTRLNDALILHLCSPQWVWYPCLDTVDIFLSMTLKSKFFSPAIAISLFLMAM